MKRYQRGLLSPSKTSTLMTRLLQSRSHESSSVGLFNGSAYESERAVKTRELLIKFMRERVLPTADEIHDMGYQDGGAKWQVGGV